MPKIISLVLACLFVALAANAQDKASTMNTATLSSGGGYSGTTLNSKSGAGDFWLQLDYRLSPKFSIATELDVMNYKQNSYYPQAPVKPNDIQVKDNNFSFLLKYHVQTKGKLRLALGSGWTYTISESQYYQLESSTANETDYSYRVTSFNVFRIPFLAEAAYPLAQRLDLVARATFNCSLNDGNTYATGLGLAVRL